MTRVSPRHLLLALLLVASMLFLLHALRRAKQSDRPATASVDQDEAAVREGQPYRPDTEVELAFAAPPDADFSRYAALARTNVFSERRTQPPPPKQTKPVPPPPPLPNGDGKPTAPKIDFSEWTYVGYVTLDGRQLGIVQNDTTHTCEYLAVGDEFMGAVVETVDRESVKLKAGSARSTLSRPRDFSMLPLDKSAVTEPQRSPSRPRPPAG